MIKKSVTIESDMEARPIALLVQEAIQYTSSIHIEMDDKQINAKSIMGMMSLRFGKGTSFTIVADGSDEEKAVNGVEAFLMSH